MDILKKYKIKVSLILILLLSGLLCAYSVWNYKGNTTSNPNKTEFKGDYSWQGQVPNGKEPQNHVEGNKSPNDRNNSGPKPNRPMDYASSGIKYNVQIEAYSIMFLSLFAAAYYFLNHKKIRIDASNTKILILTLMCIGLFLRIFIATFIEGHPSDLNLFKSWATTASNSLLQVYSNSRSSDYPPLYMYVLFLIGKLASISAVNPYYTLLLKLPSIAADLLSALIIYRLSIKHFSLEISMLLSAFYIFNPAVIVNSAVWGQVDSLFTLIVITSVFLLEKEKVGLSAVMFTAAVLMKPQGIIFLPVLFFELVRNKKLKNFLKAAAAAIITTLVIIFPFSINKGFTWIFKLYSSTVGEYPYASVNAFNFFSLIGKNYVKDSAMLFGISYHNWGMIFIVMITAFSWFIYIKGNDRAFAPAIMLVQIAGVFTFSASMHERYLFPAAALAILAFIYLRDKRFLLLCLGFSTTIFINTYYVLYETMKGVNSIAYGPVLVITSLMNVLLCVYLVKILFDVLIRKKVFQLE